MTVTPASRETQPAARDSFPRSRFRNQRRGREVLAEWVFRPLAQPLVAVLGALRIAPPAVVLANAAAGLAAVVAIADGRLVAAVLLLQLKTVLDNADGLLARVSGRASSLGRYLDTESDLVVNAALFAALGSATGRPALALAGFCALTLVLSADFNADALYRRAHGETVVTQPSAAGEGRLARALACIYGVVFAPQDSLLQGISRRRFERVLAGVADPGLRSRATLAYHDGATIAVLANLGLSTQLAVLGVCLVFGVPTIYLWLVLACAAVLPLLQLRRERLARRALAR